MQTKSLLKRNYIPLLLAITSGLFYFSFGYDLVRTDSLKLLMLYAGLFFLFYKLIQLLRNNLKFLAWLALGFRAIFILAIPNLSQDFYRFIWDGRMVLEGFNPYLFTPESFFSQSEFPVTQGQELYNGMGSLSASHYTNYPPLNQLCFVIAGLFAGKNILGSVVVIRLLIITADFGTLYFGKKLLEKLKLPAHHIFWYLLNPFIIIELTGNLHFEGVMIFFLVWSLYLLHIAKWQWAALVFALSVSIKLIPLLFLPLLFQKLGWKKSISFYSLVGLVTIVLFVPFYNSEFVYNYAQTVGLWFQNFEFNASLYYIAREIGYTFRGNNEIAVIGKYIVIIVMLFVLYMAFFRTNQTTKELITVMLFVISFYYFTATTVHPWYVATILILSVFTQYKFVLVWTFTVFLSYLAYSQTNYTENLLLVVIEYVLVYAVFIWEVVLKKTIQTKQTS